MDRPVDWMSREKALRRQREYITNLKLSSGCVDCGYNAHPAALEFDHLPGTVKLGVVSRLVSVNDWHALVAEVAKCEVVCANCHRVRTATRKAAGIEARAAEPAEMLF